MKNFYYRAKVKEKGTREVCMQKENASMGME